MARRPLYPNLPGEQALDRLLNQTLPNLVQQREAKIQREEDIRRQDRIRQENLAIDEKRYQENKDRINLNDKRDANDKIFNFKMNAIEAYEKGDMSKGDAYTDKMQQVASEYNIAIADDPEELKQSSIKRGDVKLKYQSYKTDFLRAKDPESMNKALDSMIDLYEQNSDYIKWEDTIEPILVHIFENKDKEGYRELYGMKDYDKFAKSSQSYINYIKTIEPEKLDDLQESYMLANNNKIASNPQELRNYYYQQDDVKELVAAQSDNLMQQLNDEFGVNYKWEDYFVDDENNLKSQFSQQDFDRIHKVYRNAMTKKMFGGQFVFSDLEDKEDRKKIDLALQKEYGFPEIEYKSGGDGGGGEPIKTDLKSVTQERSALIVKGKTEGLTSDEQKRLNKLSEQIVAEDIESKIKTDIKNEIAQAKKEWETYTDVLGKIRRGDILTVEERELANAEPPFRNRKEYRDRIISLQRELKGYRSGGDRIGTYKEIKLLEDTLIKLKSRPAAYQEKKKDFIAKQEEKLNMLKSQLRTYYESE